MPSASSIRHKPSSWDCASIGNVKQRHRKDTILLYDLFTSQFQWLYQTFSKS